MSRRPVALRIMSGSAILASVLFASCGDSPTQPSSTQPPTLALTLNPSSTAAGQTVQGTITLTGGPSGAATVALSSSNGQVASVPATLTIPGGSSTGSFAVSTTAVTSSTTVTITASYASSPPVTTTATLTLSPPALQNFVVLDASGALTSGFDILVNTDKNQTNWLTSTADGLRAAYPSGQLWGFVAIVLNGPTNLGSRPSRDMSNYKTLRVQLRGESGGESVEVGIKDNTDPDTGAETKKTVELSSSWRSYDFPLADFSTADLRRLYLLIEVVLNGPTGRTVYLRDVQYVP
jgi:hypothetical protein